MERALRRASCCLVILPCCVQVRGKDNVGATMDSMELERQRGITIQVSPVCGRGYLSDHSPAL